MRSSFLVSFALLIGVVNLLPWVFWPPLRHTDVARRENVSGPRGYDGASRASRYSAAFLSFYPDAAIEEIPADPRNKGMELLDKYSALRADRVCPPIPSNVSIRIRDSIRVGVVRNYVQNRHRPRARRAYVAMISNHKYADGALVLGETLRRLSPALRNGSADLVLLVSEKLHPTVIEQLLTVFHEIRAVVTLAPLSKNSYYAPTFDKLYLFWLVEYDIVAFLDADTVATGDLDGLFTDAAPPPELYLSAVGGSSYFQTGLMIVRPNRLVFIDLFLEYLFGSFNYNQWRGRDGILFRNCFLLSHKSIHHPTQQHHYYGLVKPWFNKDVKRKSDKETLNFDEYYIRWWTVYEQLHRRYFVPLSNSFLDGSEEIYGGAAATPKRLQELNIVPPVDPAKYMWLQRYSKANEYLRPTQRQYEALRNYTLPTLQVVLGERGQSCTDACADRHLACRNDSLSFTAANSCDGILATLRRDNNTARCRQCVFEESTVDVPRYETEGATCRVNYLHAATRAPICSAPTRRTFRRVCTCVEHHELQAPAALAMLP